MTTLSSASLQPNTAAHRTITFKLESSPVSFNTNSILASVLAINEGGNRDQPGFAPDVIDASSLSKRTAQRLLDENIDEDFAPDPDNAETALEQTVTGIPFYNPQFKSVRGADPIFNTDLLKRLVNKLETEHALNDAQRANSAFDTICRFFGERLAARVVFDSLTQDVLDKGDWATILVKIVIRIAKFLDILLVNMMRVKEVANMLAPTIEGSGQGIALGFVRFSALLAISGDESVWRKNVMGESTFKKWLERRVGKENMDPQHFTDAMTKDQYGELPAVPLDFIAYITRPGLNSNYEIRIAFINDRSREYENYIVPGLMEIPGGALIVAPEPSAFPSLQGIAGTGIHFQTRSKVDQTSADTARIKLHMHPVFGPPELVYSVIQKIHSHAKHVTKGKGFTHFVIEAVKNFRSELKEQLLKYNLASDGDFSDTKSLLSKISTSKLKTAARLTSFYNDHTDSLNLKEIDTAAHALRNTIRLEDDDNDDSVPDAHLPIYVVNTVFKEQRHLRPKRVGLGEDDGSGRMMRDPLEQSIDAITRKVFGLDDNDPIPAAYRPNESREITQGLFFRDFMEVVFNVEKYEQSISRGYVSIGQSGMNTLIVNAMLLHFGVAELFRYVNSRKFMQAVGMESSPFKLSGSNANRFRPTMWGVLSVLMINYSAVVVLENIAVGYVSTLQMLDEVVMSMLLEYATEASDMDAMHRLQIVRVFMFILSERTVHKSLDGAITSINAWFTDKSLVDFATRLSQRVAQSSRTRPPTNTWDDPSNTRKPPGGLGGLGRFDASDEDDDDDKGDAGGMGFVPSNKTLQTAIKEKYERPAKRQRRFVRPLFSSRAFGQRRSREGFKKQDKKPPGLPQDPPFDALGAQGDSSRDPNNVATMPLPEDEEDVPENQHGANADNLDLFA